jgi:hypothetical protein
MEEGFTLSRDEYLALRRLIDSERESEGAALEAKEKPRGKRKRARKGKRMTRKTQLAINRGRKRSGLKPIKWKRKGR